MCRWSNPAFAAIATAVVGCGSAATGGAGAEGFRFAVALDERLDADDIAFVEIVASRAGGFGAIDPVTLDHGRTVETRDTDGDGARDVVLTWADVSGDLAIHVRFDNSRDEPIHLAGEARDADGDALARGERDLVVPPGGVGEVELTLTCINTNCEPATGGESESEAGVPDAGVFDDGTVGVTDAGLDAAPPDAASPDAASSDAEPDAATGCAYEDVCVAVSFSTCGQIGATGPSQAQCDTTYAGTSLAGAVSVSGGMQSWTVPATTTWRIEACGAASRWFFGGGGAGGGSGAGARMRGDFALSEGDLLTVLVGQDGSGTDPVEGSAGGGGTFVVQGDGSPLLVAAGGGSWNDASDPDISDGRVDIGDGSGGSGSSNSYYVGCGGPGSGGGGFYTDGTVDGGRAFVNGGAGATESLAGACSALGIGGFGGGGNGGNGGGGGGGYEGGDGGGFVESQANGAGGLSWNVGADQDNASGACGGDSYVTITPL